MTDDLRKDGAAQKPNPVLDVEGLCERLDERNSPGYLNIVSEDTICELLDLIAQAASALRTLAAERDEAAIAEMSALTELDNAKLDYNTLQSRLLKAVEGLKEIADDLPGTAAVHKRTEMRRLAERTLQSLEDPAP